MADKIKVALDSSTVINLFTLIHPKNDLDGKVMKGLETKTLNANDWTNLEPGSYPPILRDKFLGLRVGGAFINLMDIYNILTWIKEGSIEVYITPTAFNELENMNEVEEEFLRKYITILTINPDQEDEICALIDKLANEYVQAGGAKSEYIPKYRERSPTRDAYIMAEASLCGLSLVTCDWKDLIHSNQYAKDYAKTKIIKQVNREFKDVDLGFKSLKGAKMTTCAVKFDRFVMDVKQDKIYLYTDGDDLNINEDNEITLR